MQPEMLLGRLLVLVLGLVLLVKGSDFFVKAAAITVIKTREERIVPVP